MWYIITNQRNIYVYQLRRKVENNSDPPPPLCPSKSLCSLNDKTIPTQSNFSALFRENHRTNDALFFLVYFDFSSLFRKNHHADNVLFFDYAVARSAGLEENHLKYGRLRTSEKSHRLRFVRNVIVRLRNSNLAQ